MKKKIIFNKNFFKKSTIFFIFAIIFSSISLVNHYNFRTYAFDLGIRNNAIYDYAHFRFNDCMLMQPQFENVLSDHFQIFPIILSPFYYVFGSWTFLIFQIIFILFGGMGIKKLIFFMTKNERLSNMSLIHFFSIWGIYSALSFDFHDNVIGAMLLSWFIYFVFKENWKFAGIFLFFILISKENVAFWMFFVNLGLLSLFYKKEKNIKFISIFAIISLIYFLFIVKFVMPSLANESREYLHFKYNAIGENMSEAIKNIISKPKYIFSLLFENHLKNPGYFGIKSELHFIVLLSGGIFLIIEPRFLIMLMPIYAQKLFNNDMGKWGLNYQYSIEFVPIFTFAFFYCVANSQKMPYLQKFKNKNFKYILAYIFVISTIITTISTMDNRVSKWYSPDNLRFYSKKHYFRNFDVSDVHKKLKLIPENAILSAQGSLVPHLSFRDFIYLFPTVKNSNFIAILKSDENYYPLNKDKFLKKVSEYKNSKDWGIFYEDENLIFLEKIEF